MTKSSQQIAEELARKCAAQIAVIEFNAAKLGQNLAHTYQQDALKLQILQSIPLVELLECVREFKNSTANRGYVPVVVTNLTTKLKQLEIEV